MTKRQSGFTLIELLIVIFVIAIVAAAALYALNPARRIGESNDARRKSDLVSVGKAIELYTADRGSAPTDLANAGIAVGSKYVLCSTPGSLSCGGQTLPCRVVDDTDFLGVYLPALPIDPAKSSTADTGYYVTRANNNTLSLGACTSYGDSGVTIASRVSLPTYTVTCGDGVVAGAEVCDYNGTVCPNNASYRYSGYAYDGATCTSSSYACNTSCGACINQASCLGSCESGGVYNGGFCWYIGEAGQSCTTVCGTKTCSATNFNDDASCSRASSLITCTTCESVNNSAAPMTFSVDAGEGVETTCSYRVTANLDCSASVAFMRRICACNR